MLERTVEQKNQLQEKLEVMSIDLETAQLELILLKDEYAKEKEKAEDEKRRLAAETTLDTSPAAEVYKEKIAQLKEALEKMTLMYEGEKLKGQSQNLEIKQYGVKEKEIEEQLANMDLLIEAIDERDKIIEELKLHLDEAHGYEKMVEKLTEESLTKDEEVEKAIQKYREKVEELKTEEEINELLEEEKKELDMQLASKEAELANQKNEQLRLGAKITELKLELNRYQDKTTRLKEEIGLLQNQIKDSGQEEKLKKIEELLSRQTQLIAMLRDARKFEVDAIISRHNLSFAELKIGLFNSIIPSKLSELANIAGYDKVALLFACRSRCDSVLILLKEKYYINNNNAEINLPFISYVSELSIKFTNVLLSIDKSLYYISKCNAEQYERITRDQGKWNHVLVVDSFIVQMMELIKDELLSPQVSLDSFRVSATAVSELAEELRLLLIPVEARLKSEPEAEPSDKFLVEKCLLRADIAASVFYYLYSRNNQGNTMQMEKATKIHGNVAKAMNLLRKIRCSEDGVRYLRHWQMMEESFEQKFKYAECLWTEKEEAYANNDWTSWLEAIDAQLAGIYNHSNYRELENEGIEEKLSDVSGYGPWGVKNKEINQELSEAAELKQEIERLNEQLKNEKLEYLKLDKEVNENKIIKSSLEKRLAENQQKIERVGQLEIEKKRFLENEKIYHDSLENIQLKYDQEVQKNKELNEKLEKAEMEMIQPNISQRKNSTVRGQDMRRNTIRIPEGGTKMIYNAQDGGYYQQVIRKLIVRIT